MDDDATYETVVKGFEVNVNDQFASGITLNRSSSKDLVGATKRIENCIVHDVDPSSAAGYYGILVSAARNYDTENVEVLNNEVYNTPYTALAIYEQYGGTTTSQVRNVTVSRNTVHDSGENGSGGGFGVVIKNDVLNAVIEYNYIYNAGGLGISVENDGGTPSPENITIRHNIIYNNGKGGIYIAQSGDKNVDIYGNLIFKNNNSSSTNGTGIILESNLNGDISVKIYNNTFYQNANGGIRINSSSANFTTLEIVNNIMYSVSGKYPLYNANSSAIIAHSKNVYYRPDSGNLVYNGGLNYNSGNISSWESTSLPSNPMFNNSTNLPTGFIGTYGVDLRPNTNGLSIQTQSPLKEYGALLRNSYNSSINTVTRPSEGGWDIGAYEIGNNDQNDSVAPNSPLNLNIVLFHKRLIFKVEGAYTLPSFFQSS